MDRVEVGRILAFTVPGWEIVDVVHRPPLPDHAALSVDLLKITGVSLVVAGEHQIVSVAEPNQIVVRKIVLNRQPVKPPQFSVPVVLLDQTVGADRLGSTPSMPSLDAFPMDPRNMPLRKMDCLIR